LSDLTNTGIVTMLEIMDELLRSLTSELPFFSDKPVDFDGIKQKFDNVMDILSKIDEKTTLTHTLIQNVINSIYCSRKELRNSVNGLIKKTTDQLGKITATTEAATNQILDEAMKLDNAQNIINEKLDNLKTLTSVDEVSSHIEEIKNMVYDNQDSVFNIIQFLQFQDITAQQISGAYSLLHDTEKTLLYVSNLIKEFDIGENDFELILPEIDKNAFNADAAFVDKTNIQGAIDDLFSTGNENVEIPKEQDLNSSAMSAHSTNSNNDDSSDQIDIDALFSNNNNKSENKSNSEPANQDDIDKLFS
jgi:hypothetical protein